MNRVISGTYPHRSVPTSMPAEMMVCWPMFKRLREAACRDEKTAGPVVSYRASGAQSFPPNTGHATAAILHHRPNNKHHVTDLGRRVCWDKQDMWGEIQVWRKGKEGGRGGGGHAIADKLLVLVVLDRVLEALDLVFFGPEILDRLSGSNRG